MALVGRCLRSEAGRPLNPIRAGAVVLLVVLGTPMAVATSRATAAPPGLPLAGNVIPQLDASDGKVAVVASSAAQNGKVAVVVANGTSTPVRRVVVDGLATRPDGGVVTHATTRVTVPAVLAPGAIALGALDFGKHRIPRGAAFTFRVRSGRASTPADAGLLEVRDLTLSPPLEGAVAQTLAGRVVNAGERLQRGPVRVTVMCFDEARRPVEATTEIVEVRKLAPGKSVRATVPFATLCPTYLVGARAVG
jgi:hypothetical protein